MSSPNTSLAFVKSIRDHSKLREAAIVNAEQQTTLGQGGTGNGYLNLQQHEKIQHHIALQKQRELHSRQLTASIRAKLDANELRNQELALYQQGHKLLRQQQLLRQQAVEVATHDSTTSPN